MPAKSKKPALRSVKSTRTTTKSRPISSSARTNRNTSLISRLRAKSSPRALVLLLFVVVFAGIGVATLLGAFARNEGLASNPANNNLAFIAPRVRSCEAGGRDYRNANADTTYKSPPHGGPGYSGAYQFNRSLWGNYKGYANASDAPKQIQDEKFNQVYSSNGYRGKSHWTADVTSVRCWNWPNGTIKNAPAYTGATGTPTPTASSSKDLYYVKTSNTGGTIEVHRATAASNYASANLHSTSAVSVNEGSYGTFQIGQNNDLYYIKTRGTGSNRIEIHAYTAASGYKSASIHVATAFPLSDGADGIFQMVGADLYYIKTKNVGSGRIEVHAVTGASNYQSFSVHAASGYGVGDAANGTFNISESNRDLYYIKTSNTGGGRIEVHAATAGSNYAGFSVHANSAFPVADGSNGVWQIFGTDLYFVKTRNNGGRIEVHAVTAGSGYASFSLHALSLFANSDASSGRFQIK